MKVLDSNGDWKDVKKILVNNNGTWVEVQKILRPSDNVTLYTKPAATYSITFYNFYKTASGTILAITLNVTNNTDNSTNNVSLTNNTSAKTTITTNSLKINSVKYSSSVKFDVRLGSATGTLVGNNVTSWENTFSANTTYYICNPNIRYLITYNANDGTTTKTYQYVGPDSTLNSCSFNRTYYTFLGWALSSSGDVVLLNNATVGNSISSSCNLYAKWKIVLYNITFKPNGGTWLDNGTASVTGDKIVPTDRGSIPNPGTITRTNATFELWIDVNTSNPTAAYGAKTYYACWLYTITLYSASGDGASITNTVVSSDNDPTTTGNAIYTVPENTFTKSGYTFNGWKLGSISGTSLTVGLEIEISANTKIYASWTQLTTTYTITYSANGGTGTMANTTFTAGSNVKLSKCLFRKTNYTFKCWQKGLTTTYYPDEYTIKNISASNLSLKALYGNDTLYTLLIEYGWTGYATGETRPEFEIQVYGNYINYSTLYLKGGKISLAAGTQYAIVMSSSNAYISYVSVDEEDGELDAWDFSSTDTPTFTIPTSSASSAESLYITFTKK